MRRIASFNVRLKTDGISEKAIRQRSFNGQLAGRPGTAGYQNVKPFCILVQQEMPEVAMMTTGTTRKATASYILSGHLTSTLAAVCVLQTQPRWSYLLPDVQRSATVPFQWLPHARGTVCRRPLGMRHR